MALEVPGFSIERRVAAGSGGEVFFARHAGSGAPVALKRLLHADARMLSLWDTEVRATARLDHEHVVRILDQGTTADGDRFLALEWCDAGVARPREWDDLHRLLIQVLGALGHAHAHHVLHRDVKPQNILATRTGAFKLADFGVARVRGIRSGQRVGTPYTIAPEVVLRRTQGPSTDLYSLGCTAWMLATGHPPFDKPSLPATLAAHVDSDLPPFEPSFAVPAGFESWVRLLLEKRPEDRPGFASVASAELERLAGRPSRSVRTGNRGRDQRLEDVGIGLLAHREPPMTGRDAELAALSKRMEEGIATSTPHVAVLVGETGSGRTRLAREVAAAAHARGLAEWLDVDVGEGLETLDDELERAAGSARVLVLRGVPDGFRSRTVADRILRARGPLTWLVVADSVPRSLLRRLPSDATTVVRLDPLSWGHMHELLRAWAPLSPGLRSEVVERSGGLPGNALGWLRSLARRERLVPGASGYALGDGATESIDLDANLARTLSVVAACGGRLASELWADALSEVGESPDWPALARLTRAALAQLRVRGGVEHLELDPALTEAILAKGHPPIALVRAVAQRLPEGDVQLAMLWSATDDHATYLRVSEGVARRAVHRADFGLAAGVLERAVVRAQDAGVVASWKARVALLNALLALSVDAASPWFEAWEPEISTAPVNEAASFWERKTRAARMRGDIPAAREALAELEALVDADTPGVDVGLQAVAVAGERLWLGDDDEAERRIHQALAQPLGPYIRSRAYFNLLRLEGRRNDLEAARAAAMECIACGSEFPEMHSMAWAQLGEVASRVGDVELARAALQNSLDEGRGVQQAEAPIYQLNLALLDVRTGRHEEALAILATMEHDLAVRRLALARIGVAQVQAVALLELGRWDEAEMALGRLIVRAEQASGLSDPDLAALSETCLHLARESGRVRLVELALEGQSTLVR